MRHGESDGVGFWVAKKTIRHAHGITGKDDNLNLGRFLQQSRWDYRRQLIAAGESREKHLAVVMQIIGIGSPKCDALTEKLVVEF